MGSRWKDDRVALHRERDACGRSTRCGNSGRGCCVRGISGRAADIVDPATRTVQQISPTDMYVYEFDWAPDSKRLVVTAAHGNGDDNWYFAGLFAIDAASGTMRDVLAKPGMQIAIPRWSPDGGKIAFIGGLMSDEAIVGGNVFIVPTAGGSARNLTPEMKASASWLAWASDSKKIRIAQYVDGASGIGEV